MPLEPPFEWASHPFTAVQLRRIQPCTQVLTPLRPPGRGIDLVKASTHCCRKYDPIFYAKANTGTNQTATFWRIDDVGWTGNKGAFLKLVSYFGEPTFAIYLDQLQLERVLSKCPARFRLVTQLISNSQVRELEI